MNCICEVRLYSVCGCKNKYHLPITLPLYDGHCHVDLFFNYGLNEMDLRNQLSNGRKMIFFNNRHQYYRWFTNYELKIPSSKVYTTYGIHPKYIPSNSKDVFEQLENIFKNKLNVNTETVGIGECGLDETNSDSYESQLIFLRLQQKLAAELELPLVLHGRGTDAFNLMLHELKLHLNHNHKIHWHCINPKSDLNVVSSFLNYFENSFIGLNCSIICQHDIELQNFFHKWLLKQENVLCWIILETDYPFLKPFLCTQKVSTL